MFNWYRLSIAIDELIMFNWCRDVAINELIMFNWYRDVAINELVMQTRACSIGID